MTINCEKCGSKTQVVDTRGDGENCYRQRFCPNCIRSFYTKESIVNYRVGRSGTDESVKSCYGKD